MPNSPEVEQRIEASEPVELKKSLAEVASPASEAVATITSEREEILQRLSEGRPVPQPLPEKAETHKLSPEQSEFLATLEERFAERPRHYLRPKGIHFAEVEKALLANPALMNILAKMESTGGEPDIIGIEADAFVFADCAAQSPSGRRNLTYDQALAMAKELGVKMMNEMQYRLFLRAGRFDRFNSWVWIETPSEIREDGHALHGYCVEGVAEIGRRAAQHHDKHGGWRGILWVPRA